MMQAQAVSSPQANDPFFREKVTWVRHWTEQLFSLRVTRPTSFRFASGQFIMLGLEVSGRPLLRAYSIVSPNWEDELEFYSVKVPDGPLTSILKSVQPGDTILLSRKPTGTLVLDALRPGRTLYLLSTGTGLAPFLSIIRDPQAYEQYEKIAVAHTFRRAADQSYRELLSREIHQDEHLSELVRGKLLYYPSATRENFHTQGRITDLIWSGKFSSDLQLSELDPDRDRVMLCGNPAFLVETKELLEDAGFHEGSIAMPGDYVVEKAFVET